ncbi:MAG: hypothetical protein ACR2GH_08710 [Pseudonocardia sp.]
MCRTWLLGLLLVITLGCSAGTPAGPEPADRELAERIARLRADPPPILTGVVANSGPPEDAAKIGVLDPPLVRVEFPIETSPAQIQPYVDAYAVEGTRVLLLAGFAGRTPTEPDARNLGRWAAAFGPASGRLLPVPAIEFGNETSYTYQYDDSPQDESYTERARTYARLAAVASDAIRAVDPEVGLLVQADDANTGPVWIDAMFDAVPDLAEHVTGWTIHPYGPGYDARLNRARTQLSKHAAVRPLWITEWGLALDDGRCLEDNRGWDRCLDAEQAAAILLQVVADLARHDVGAFLVYQGYDQRSPDVDSNPERHYGVLTVQGNDKGVYTEAVRALWGR